MNNLAFPVLVAAFSLGACSALDKGKGVVEFNLNYSVGKLLSASKFGNFVKNSPRLQVDSQTYGLEGGFQNGCRFLVFVSAETGVVVGWKYVDEAAKKRCDEIEGHAGGQ